MNRNRQVGSELREAIMPVLMASMSLGSASRMRDFAMGFGGGVAIVGARI